MRIPIHNSLLINKLRHYRAFWTISLSVLALDLITKQWVVTSIPPGTYSPPGAISIIDNFFYLVHVHNYGAAWSQFSGHSTLLALLGILALSLIFIFRKTLELQTLKIQIIFGMITGGISGNLLNRLYSGYVIDFLDVHLPGYRWPAFNIADCGISIGVTLYIIVTLFDTKAKTD